KLLKKSFFDFNSLFENSNQAFLLIDGNLFIRNFNKTADTNSHRILKRSLLINKSITNYIYPENFPNFYELLKKVFKGESVNSEFSLKDYDGDSMWFQMNLSPIVEEDGLVGFVLIGINNISDHARRSISILESITDGMFALDNDYNFPMSIQKRKR
ncbi:MAG: PAS domain S-box protein, partial [Bacteroidota bacterium]|nr:PAS domain S-box protein [Bacteroidota bacterium]